MKCRVDLHPLALQEMTETVQWYEDRSPGLGTRFIEALNERLTEISAFPDRYPKKKGLFREVSTKIFPYIIIFEFLQKEKVVFVSYIFHIKRNPQLKYNRKR